MLLAPRIVSNDADKIIRLRGRAKNAPPGYIYNGKCWSLGNNKRRTPCGIATIGRLLRTDVRLAGVNHWIGLAARRAQRGASGRAGVDLVVDSRGLHAGAARTDVRGTGRHLPCGWRGGEVSLLLA